MYEYIYMYVEKKVSNVLLRDGGNPTTEGHIFVKKKAPSVPVSVCRQRRGFSPFPATLCCGLCFITETDHVDRSHDRLSRCKAEPNVLTQLRCYAYAGGITQP